MKYSNGPTMTFGVGSAALAPYRLCKLISAELEYMSDTSTDQPVGATLDFADADSEASVKLITSPGTLEVEAAGAATKGADAYAADDGKVQALPVAAGTYRRIGIFLEAASGAGAIVEVLPVNFNSTTTVSA